MSMNSVKQKVMIMNSIMVSTVMILGKLPAFSYQVPDLGFCVSEEGGGGGGSWK